MRNLFLAIFLFSTIGLRAELNEQIFPSHSEELKFSGHGHCIPTYSSNRCGGGCDCPVYGSFYLVTSQPIRLSPGAAIPFDELTAVKTPGIRVSPHKQGEIIIEEMGDYLLTYAASVIGASPHLETPRTALSLNSTTIVPGSEIRYHVEATLSPTMSKIIRISTVPATLKFINHTPYQDIIINSIDDEVAAYLVIQKIDN